MRHTENIQMKIVLVFVSTLDGKITKWGDPKVKKWSSPEDKKYFRKVWNDARVIVMGSNTFKAEPVKTGRDQLLIVMTSQPAYYTSYSIPGTIEFSDESPGELASRLAGEGYDQMLLVGGPKVATSFLKEDLVDELWLTIEPLIFGSGNIITTSEDLDIKLKIISLEKVNDSGTLITRYSVIKNLPV
jgi:dihydrofolate reductase